MAKSIKNSTKGDLTFAENYPFTYQDYQLSCLMRIADATERMAVNYEQIIQAKNKAEKDRDFYDGQYRRVLKERDALQRSQNSLRGVVTRTKNKNEAKQNDTLLAEINNLRERLGYSILSRAADYMALGRLRTDDDFDAWYISDGVDFLIEHRNKNFKNEQGE